MQAGRLETQRRTTCVSRNPLFILRSLAKDWDEACHIMEDDLLSFISKIKAPEKHLGSCLLKFWVLSHHQVATKASQVACRKDVNQRVRGQSQMAFLL